MLPNTRYITSCAGRESCQEKSEKKEEQVRSVTISWSDTQGKEGRSCFLIIRMYHWLTDANRTIDEWEGRKIKEDDMKKERYSSSPSLRKLVFDYRLQMSFRVTEWRRMSNLTLVHYHEIWYGPQKYPPSAVLWHRRLISHPELALFSSNEGRRHHYHYRKNNRKRAASLVFRYSVFHWTFSDVSESMRLWIQKFLETRRHRYI